MVTTLEHYDQAGLELEGQLFYEPNWYLLRVAAEAHASLLYLVETANIACKPAARPHISVIKGEAPNRNQADWGVAFVGETVTFRYVPVLQAENGLHLWIDCHSPGLCTIREHFGLPTLRRSDGAYLVNFHLTLGRRKKAVTPQLRPQLRLSPQSHIDLETGMQHL
ncbi:MAG: hypothetical protein LCH85_07125 [Chloroflexi bacterium]|nr:hypothetical protein [Chloroflexota bacterium]